MPLVGILTVLANIGKTFIKHVKFDADLTMH